MQYREQVVCETSDLQGKLEKSEGALSRASLDVNRCAESATGALVKYDAHVANLTLDLQARPLTLSMTVLLFCRSNSLSLRACAFDFGNRSH